EVAFRCPGAAKCQREPCPSRFARDAITQRLIRVADRGCASGTPGEAGQHDQRGDPCRRVWAREVRAQPQSLRDQLLHVLIILARVTTTPTDAAAPALKEWAAIVHALLEGEQIVDVRKGGLHEDGRHFDLPARRFFLSPTAKHQKPELLKP